MSNDEFTYHYSEESPLDSIRNKLREADRNPSSLARDEAEVAAFEVGLAQGRDPLRNESGVEGEVTTRYSTWYSRACCPVTGHNFREGDRVAFGADGSVELLLPDVLPLDADCAAYLKGLETTYFAQRGDKQPGGHNTRDLDTIILEPDLDQPGVPREFIQRLLRAPIPRAQVGRRTCYICTRTLRQGEKVVVCPCPIKQCHLVVHRDPARGLNCLDDFFPDGVVRSCLATSQDLPP